MRPLERFDLRDDLVGGERSHLVATLRAVLDADPRVEYPEVVVDLGDRADGGSGVGGGGLLLDRNRRTQAADVVVRRLFHLTEELARIARQGLDVSTLPFRIECVERQRGFSRPADAREDDQLLLGDPELRDLEVVLAGAANHDASLRARPSHVVKLHRRPVQLNRSRTIRRSTLIPSSVARITGPPSKRPSGARTTLPRRRCSSSLRRVRTSGRRRSTHKCRYRSDRKRNPARRWRGRSTDLGTGWRCYPDR